MRILYGVQGTGNGHITRARVMAKAFTQLGIDVDYLFSGREPDQYFDMACFAQQQYKKGFSLSHKQGYVANWQTLRQADFGQFYRDVKALPVKAYDFVVSDFEPVSAWAAKLAKVPCVALSHQAALLFGQADNAKLSWLNKQFLTWFAPADCYLGVNWQAEHHQVIPPFVHALPSKVGVANKIVVYLPFEHLDDIIEMLADHGEYEFYIYHPHARPHSQGHLHFFAPSREAFLADLVNSAGVIANAGFELACEALSLGKKLLLKPLAGQFEQLSNALDLERRSWASTMSWLDPEAVSDWLRRRNSVSVEFPSDPVPLVSWLCQKNWHDCRDISSQLWQQVRVSQRTA